MQQLLTLICSAKDLALLVADVPGAPVDPIVDALTRPVVVRVAAVTIIVEKAEDLVLPSTAQQQPLPAAHTDQRPDHHSKTALRLKNK